MYVDIVKENIRDKIKYILYNTTMIARSPRAEARQKAIKSAVTAAKKLQAENTVLRRTALIKKLRAFNQNGFDDLLIDESKHKNASTLNLYFPPENFLTAYEGNNEREYKWGPENKRRARANAQAKANANAQAKQKSK